MQWHFISDTAFTPAPKYCAGHACVCVCVEMLTVMNMNILYCGIWCCVAGSNLPNFWGTFISVFRTEALGSEISVRFIQTTRHHMPEDSSLYYTVSCLVYRVKHHFYSKFAVLAYCIFSVFACLPSCIGILAFVWCLM